MIVPVNDQGQIQIHNLKKQRPLTSKRAPLPPGKGHVQQVQAFDGFDKKVWVLELKQLKKEYIIEDRDRFRPLLRIKKEDTIAEFMDEIEKLEKKTEIGARREQAQMIESIQKCKNDVQTAKTMIKQSKIDSSYLDRIQNKVHNIELNLKNFKLKSRATFESMATEEIDLTQDLEMMESRFDAWEQENESSELVSSQLQSSQSTSELSSRQRRQRPSSVSHRLYRPTSATREMPKESPVPKVLQSQKIKEKIEDLDATILANGGVNCGWDASDHKDYLRIRTKHGNKAITVAFIAEIQRSVPNVDPPSIRAHAKAHQNYTDLAEKKKKMIIEYKKAKEDEKHQKLQKIDSQVELYSNINGQLALIDDNKTSNGVVAKPRNYSQSAQERAQVKKDLEKWKKEKESAKRKTNEDKLMKDEQMKKRLQQKLDVERRAKKSQVEEFKYAKEMERQRTKQLEELAKNAQKIDRDVKQRLIKREEDAFMKKQEALHNHMQKQTNKKEELLSGPNRPASAKYSNVGSRLHNETKAMEEKKRAKFDPSEGGQKRDAMTMGGNVLGLRMAAKSGW